MFYLLSLVFSDLKLLVILVAQILKKIYVVKPTCNGTPRDLNIFLFESGFHVTYVGTDS